MPLTQSRIVWHSLQRLNPRAATVQDSDDSDSQSSQSESSVESDNTAGDHGSMPDLQEPSEDGSDAPKATAPNGAAGRRPAQAAAQDNASDDSDNPPGLVDSSDESDGGGSDAGSIESVPDLLSPVRICARVVLGCLFALLLAACYACVCTWHPCVHWLGPGLASFASADAHS